jgi:hypothetical protein
MDKNMKYVEEKIANIFSSNTFGAFFANELSTLVELDTKKERLIRDREVD